MKIFKRHPKTVTLVITGNDGRSSIVTLARGDTLDINHTITGRGYPDINLKVQGRAATIRIAP
jgi:hypothetical protein